jgi:hypothetical protein
MTEHALTPPPEAQATAAAGSLETAGQIGDLLRWASGRCAASVEGLSESEQDRAALFVTSALDLALEMWLKKADPGRPEWTSWEHPRRKYGGDNPWTLYLSAPVSPAHQYRLSGRLRSCHYLGLQLYGLVEGFNAPTARLSGTDLGLDDEGRFELVVGGDRPTGGRPWLPLGGDDYLAMMRLYSYGGPPDARIDIECIGGGSADAPDIGACLAKVASYFKAEVLSTIQLTELMRAGGVNAFAPPDAPVRRPEYGDSLFPTLDNAYEGFFVDLQPDEALLLHGVLPDAHYSSFVFYDRWWSTLDYPAVRCFLTDRDLVLNADDTYDLVIAPTDPGVPNWIDTAGLTQGLFASRYLLAKTRPRPDVRVVKAADVRRLTAARPADI